MNNYLDEIIERLDDATRYERYITSLCPFHDDHRPSFFVYEDNYKCLSCNAFGRTENLLERLGKGIFVPKLTKPDFRNPWTQWLKCGSLKEIILSASKNTPSIYMRERGISDTIQKKLQIGLRENWITFPIVDQHNKIIGAIARAGHGNVSSAKYVTPRGQSPDLLYIPSWKRVEEASRTIFLTFGIVDSISLFSLGLASISTTSGKRLDPRALDQFRKIIYILPDHQESKEAHRLASRLGWRGKVISISYPDNSKDINDLLVKDKEFLLSVLGVYNDDDLDGCK